MAVAQDKRASELTAPVSIADTDVFPGYRPGTGGEPNLDIRASAGLIRAPILAGLAAGDVAVGLAASVATARVARSAFDALRERYSVEDAGAAEGGSSGANAAAIQNAIDTLPTDKLWDIIVPDGRSYDVDAIAINRPGISLSGGGQLVQTAPLTIGASKAAFQNADRSLIRFFFRVRNVAFALASASSSVNHIELQYVRNGSIDHCTFTKGRAGIHFVEPAADAYNAAYVSGGGSAVDWLARAVAEIEIERNKFRDLIYAVTTEGVDPGFVMFPFGDSLLSGNNVHFSPGTPRYITGMLLRGFDGLTVVHNYIFGGGFQFHSTTKERNLDVIRSTNIVTAGNQCFEAGLEGIRFHQCEKFTSTGDKVIWPGQVAFTYGVAVTGGNPRDSTAADVIGQINGLTVERGTLGGVYVDPECLEVTVSAVMSDTAQLDTGAVPIANTDITLPSTAIAISSITLAASTNWVKIVTSAPHGLRAGQYIVPINVAGMTQINRVRYQIKIDDSTTFQLYGIDGSAFGAYTSGGSIVPVWGAHVAGNQVGGHIHADIPINNKRTGSGQRTSLTGFGGLERIDQSTNQLEVDDSFAGTISPLDVWGIDQVNFSRTSTTTVSAFSYKGTTGASSIPNNKRVRLNFFNEKTILPASSSSAWPGGADIYSYNGLRMEIELRSGVWYVVAANSLSPPTRNVAKAADFSVTDADHNVTFLCTQASNLTATIPAYTALRPNFRCFIYNQGVVGTLTVDGAGGTNQTPTAGQRTEIFRADTTVRAITPSSVSNG